jgi:hypothetical protein
MSPENKLPKHENLFHYNMTLAMVGEGFSTIVNAVNYFTPEIWGEDYNSPAVLDLKFFDEDGREGFRLQRELPPYGGAHIDVATELGAKGRNRQTAGIVYGRLILHQIPKRLHGKRISTELTSEIETPSGAKDFMHNLGSPSYVPSVGRYSSGLMFADQYTNPSSIVLVNRYMGPRIPFVSEGFAKVTVINHRGEKRVAKSDVVPARGLRFFKISEHFPDIHEFFAGECGRLDFWSANLQAKPWVWFGSSDGRTEISIDHT